MKPVPALIAILALALTLATPASAALVVGAHAPDFTTRGVQGSTVITVSLSELLKQAPVVLYFFPSAFTDGPECRDFADNIDRFRGAGATVIGMSRDTVETLARFSTEECAGKFPLAFASEAMVNGFDVNDGAMFNTRTTYIIDSSGKIMFVYDDDDYTDHVRRAISALPVARETKK